MHQSAATASDTKALLTLWLLKTGTTAAEIRISLQLAATSRVMAAEERGFAATADAPVALAHNVSPLHPGTDADLLKEAREAHFAAEAMNSDIKALITLSLLKIGTSQEEIHRALRLAARSRAADAQEPANGISAEEFLATADGASASSPKQVFRNEQLAPLLSHGYAAA